MDGYIDKCWRWTAIIWLSSTAPSLPCRLLHWDKDKVYLVNFCIRIKISMQLYKCIDDSGCGSR